METSKSQRQIVLEYMKKNGSITQLEATYNCGNILRLGAVIYDLRHRDGIDIETIDVINKSGHGTHAKYILKTNEI